MRHITSSGMGKVSEFLKSLLLKQLADKGMVLWFDPEGHYSSFISELSLPDASIECYDGSFFGLRHRIDPLLNGDDPPRLVVYVPMDEAQTGHALVEIEAAGVVMKPGQQPPARNTKLSIVARNALRPIVGEETAAAIEKQVEAGKLTLAELDALAARGEGIATGVTTIIFGTANPPEVALMFLSGDRFDEEIVKKKAAGELATLLGAEFGIELPAGAPLADLRDRLARHILGTELVVSIAGEPPSQLSSLKSAPGPVTQSCVALARRWRVRTDLREIYAECAQKVEEELGLAKIDFSLDQIAEVETFPGIEKALQGHVERSLHDRATDELIDLIRRRQAGFWAERRPEVQARWMLIDGAAQLLREADRVEKELKTRGENVKQIITAYTDGDRPWCLLDTWHQQMERRYHDFEAGAGDDLHDIEKLIAKARQRYMGVGSMLAERFLRRYREAKFKAKGVLQQREIFEKRIKPQIERGKIAYVLVDALRYEMGRSLAKMLTPDFEVQLEAALATPPTITEVGMAALLPGAHEGAKVLAAGSGKLAFVIKDTILKDRKDRVKYIQTRAGVGFFECKLADLLPNPKAKIKNGIAGAGLILVTSQEIDELCEGDNVPTARKMMEGVLNDLRRAFRNLSGLGVERIVFTADHGYVFGEELDSDMKIDAPGGDTVDLHRRVWVGRGGGASDSFLRAKLADFGLAGDLEIAVPWNFACFKVKGGASAYFHGGLSPQELIIPVATLQPLKREQSARLPEIEWELIPGSPKISTRFFSVKITGEASGLFRVEPPKVRIEIRHKNEVISMTGGAAYGFEDATGDILLALDAGDARRIIPNNVVLMMTKEDIKGQATVHLLDAISGLELCRPLAIVIDISL